MSAVVDRLRLYAALARRVAAHVHKQVHSRVTKSPVEAHPLGWSPRKDLAVGLMRTLFEVGRYNHWRNFIRLMVALGQQPEGVAVTAVPGSTFSSPGMRESYWVELEPQLRPAEPKAELVLMFLHGGAFLAGEPLMYLQAYARLMREAAARGVALRVLAVGYPLAPEHRFPGGLLGVAEVYRWLVEQMGGSADRIVLAGDSAGGNLTITVLAHMRDLAAGDRGAVPHGAAAAGGEQQQQQQQQQERAPFHSPLAAVMVSPASNFTSSSVFALFDEQQQGGRGASSSDGQGDAFQFDYVCRNEGVDVMQLYLGCDTPEDLADPLVSPVLLPSFDGLVQRELLVVAGQAEAMAGDIRRFVETVRRVSPGVAVSLHEEPREPHCYCLLSGGERKGAAVLVPFLERVACGTPGAGGGGGGAKP